LPAKANIGIVTGLIVTNVMKYHFDRAKQNLEWLEEIDRKRRNSAGLEGIDRINQQNNGGLM
jgi:hypothetical protein